MKKRAFRLFMAFCLVLLCFGGTLVAKEKGPKIYISVDMEGIGAIVNSAQTGTGGFEYSKGRKLMTAEVNAAIEGCLEAGAGQIVISDSHGNAQNLIPDEIHESALLIRSFPRSFFSEVLAPDGGD
jgi:D-aminopeptidase